MKSSAGQIILGVRLVHALWGAEVYSVVYKLPIQRVRLWQQNICFWLWQQIYVFWLWRFD